MDCRALADTNGDHVVDDRDTCVPVGGFINGLRPVNLAADLIADAQSGTEYVSPYQQDNGAQATPVGGSYDTSDVNFTHVVFAPDVTTDDEPTEVVAALPSNPQNVCAFWDYSGMQDGMSWEADWFVDGTLDEGASIVGDTWAGGESGNWWVCVDRPDRPPGRHLRGGPAGGRGVGGILGAVRGRRSRSGRPDNPERRLHRDLRRGRVPGQGPELGRRQTRPGESPCPPAPTSRYKSARATTTS